MMLPFVREILADAERIPAFQRAAPLLKSRTGRIRVSGLTPTAKALYLPLVERAAAAPVMVVVPDNRAAEAMLPAVRSFCELTGALPAQQVIVFPAHDVLPFEGLSPHPGIQEQRASALWKMATGAASIVIAPIEATGMRLRPPEFYAQLAQTIRRGEAVAIDSLLGHLNTVGYTATDLVEMPGQYALRGGILDVYPPEADRPLRVEFIGDEIESLRKFDPASQRSSASHPADEAVLLPLTEVPVSEQLLAAIHTRLSARRVQGPAEAVRDSLISAGVTVFPGWEFYASIAVAPLKEDGRPGAAGLSLFQLLPEPTVLMDEPAMLRAQLEGWWEKVVAMHRRSGIGGLVQPEELYFDSDQWWEIVHSLPGADLEYLTVGQGNGAEEGQRHATFSTRPPARFHGSVPAMVEEVQKLNAGGQRVVFCVPSIGEVERLADIFAEYNVPFRLGTRVPAPGSESYLDESSYFAGDLSATTIVKAAVPNGVSVPQANLVIFGGRDLFDESEAVVTRPLRQKSKIGAFLSDFRDLAIGDYVVHVEHGIGQYQGLKEISQGETSGEFMMLEFAESAKLYVPLTRLDLVQKYRSLEGAKPQLSRLGGAAWARTKARVKSAMRDMADELLKLYAARKTAPGHAFAPDSEWQHEFEDAFEHNETEDQAQAVADVKRDMESPLPMDRLLCGDVGYGKTEVAMRAAFKAVSDNRQVAVLAPTTVLAFQHFETFKQRFAGFPIFIEMLSRFRTAKQQKEILQRLESGKVDILIGTHRLLSKDIKFADLGLVVVDEEQRFGVRHKERLKQLKKEVDVLTMSATPIPRTLHMSLVGLRDMSVIETPPQDRMAIQTVVAAFDEKLVKSAIEHELERGGQVYFLHNRVDSIYEIAAKAQALAPGARVVVGHGQMSENELERAMLKFIRHQADVLVATTIIENGLDIPLCNTIIINRADRHGLAELYQLRGRVGRSNRRAYAYLLIPAENELTPLARQRLAALKEFSDLGAGFKIAALDLELRGAGNLLGAEQSGHIDAVGFEMYTTMLERTVRELKGEAEELRAPAQLNLGINLRLPNDYVADENQRLQMYKRVAAVESEAQLADVGAELEDRFGPLPSAARNLLKAAALKLMCQRLGVTSIDRKREMVSIKFSEAASIDSGRLARFVASRRAAQFTPSGTLRFTPASVQAQELLQELRALLEELSLEGVAVE